MRILQFKVAGQNLSKDGDFSGIVAGTKGYLYTEYNFDSEWEQPGSTNPYAKGDKVMHNGKTWQSTTDNNVWEPCVYGWEEV